jgi:hypothetical protein
LHWLLRLRGLRLRGLLNPEGPCLLLWNVVMLLLVLLPYNLMNLLLQLVCLLWRRLLLFSYL